MRLIMMIGMLIVPTLMAIFISRNLLKKIFVNNIFCDFFITFLILNILTYVVSCIRGVYGFSYKNVTYSYCIKWIILSIAISLIVIIIRCFYYKIEICLEKSIRIAVDKYFDRICFTLILIISILIRYYLSSWKESGDYKNYVALWISEYQSYSFMEGLSHTVTNYYIPYSIIVNLISRLPIPSEIGIAFFSCFFEYITCIYVYKLFSIFMDSRKSKFLAFSTLYMPIVVLNGALWKQCDSIYSCFAIMCVYYFIRCEYIKAIIFFSVGFVFKQQIIFLFPFLLIMYVKNKKMHIFDFLIIPLVYIIGGVPAILAKRNIWDTYSVYYAQVIKYKQMTLNAANIYQLGLNDYDVLHIPAILFTIAIFLFGICRIYNNLVLTEKKIIGIAAWSVTTCYMFLPAMHERYDYLAILLVFIYYEISSKRKWIPIVITTCSTMMYCKFLFHYQINDLIVVCMALVYFVSWIYLSADTLEIEFNGREKTNGLHI